MKILITGLTAAGKSSLFSACTGAEVREGSVKKQIGVVDVPDERLDRLSAMFNPKKTVFTTIDFVDTVPIDTQQKQERISLFDSLRTADAILGCIGGYRCNDVNEIIDELDKLRLEIIINDLDMAVKRSERLEKDIKIAKNKVEKQKELDLVLKVQPHLEAGRFLYSMDFDKDELAIMNNFALLSRKPFVYVINIGSSAPSPDEIEAEIKKYLDKQGDPSPVILLNASIESEIAVMEPDERGEFLAEYGIAECGKDRVIKAAYSRLNLITFSTVGEDECRSWKIPLHSSSVDAAAAIHSDLARGFIRAEVIDSATLLELGSMQEAKKAGKLRLEGKNYEVQDGDIVHIMFNI